MPRRALDRRVVTSVGVGDRDVPYLRRLRCAVERFWNGPAIFYDGSYPPGCSEGDSSIGARAIEEAVRLGHTSILFSDVCTVAAVEVAPIFDHLRDVGYILIKDGHKLRDWTSDAMLAWAGIARNDVPTTQEIASAGFVGLDIEHSTGKMVYEKWIEAVSKDLTRVLWSNDPIGDRNCAKSFHTGEFIAHDPTVQGSLGDDAVLGLLAFKYGLQTEAGCNPWCSQDASGIFRSTGYDDSVMVFGCSGIVEDLYLWIRDHVPEGGLILEIGSGDVSTKHLSRHYRVISIEDSPNFLNKYPDVEYIHAPLDEDGWYNTAPIKKMLDRLTQRGERYDLLLVDGPAGSKARARFADHMDLFDLTPPVVIDDVDRPAERGIAEEISRRTGRQVLWTTHYAII